MIIDLRNNILKVFTCGQTMYKRQRLDYLPGDNNTMDIEVYEQNDHRPDIIQRLGGTDPKILQLLNEIMPAGRVKLVEQSSEPLGITPISNHRKLIDGQELIELSSGIELADNQAKFKITNKLEMIAEQVKFLRQQAFNVIKEGQESMKLNHVACNFRKVPGNTYYVYRKPSSQLYFSVLSPLDWQGQPPHEYCGSYIYQYDHTWSRSLEQFNYLLEK